MADELLLVSHFVAAAGMLGLAGWLLWLNPRSTVNRSFAFFLVVRSAVIIANRMRGLAEQAGDAQKAEFWQAIREYYHLALIPALLYFFVAYMGFRHRKRLRIVVVVAALLVQGTYVADHCLDQCTTSTGEFELGPLALVGYLGFGLVMGVVGLAILFRAGQVPGHPRHRAAKAVAIGLLLTPLLEVSLVAGIALQFGVSQITASYAPSFFVTAGHVLLVLGAVPAFIGIGWLAWTSHSNQTVRQTMAILLVALLMTASGFYVGWKASVPNWLPGIFLMGLWRILLPAVVVYALVRHRLFDADVRLRWTVMRGTMALIFLGVFFVGAQLAQNYLSTAYGWSLGGLAAGLLLFAISPIQRLAERFAQNVVPQGRSPQGMSETERLELYRQQATLVWSDGFMGRKERALLDHLRDRLQLDATACAAIETEAARGGQHATSGKRGRSAPSRAT